MLFSSLEFIFLFLPIALGAYFATPKKARNLTLFLSGLCFYGFGEPKFLPLMLLTVLVDFLFGLWIERRVTKGKSARLLLIIAIALNIGQLAFFKYFDFFDIGLPIGISFYTFQALSYVVDVYRQATKANKSFVDFGAYVSLFPQLVAGPIVKYNDISEQLLVRTHSLDAISSGFRRFCAGLAKKTLLANVAGHMWETLANEQSFIGSYLAVFFFAMQIYFDFSGYSDMAIGLGRVFGFEFLENFNYPYTSKSITEFWRRWHISLSSWFREYVYIPLGGNRRGRARTYLNLLVTWMLTGMWHGGTLNFLLWGLYFAALLIIEKAFFGKILEKMPLFLSRAYALFFIGLGWVIFCSDGSLDGFSGIGLALRLFGIGCESFCSDVALYQVVRNLPFIAILSFGSTHLPKRIYYRLKEKNAVALFILDTALPLASLILSTAYIVSSEYNPFLYFRF